MGQIRAKLVQPISGNVQIQSGPSSFINAVILALRLRNAINPLMLRNLKFINYEKKNKEKRKEMNLIVDSVKNIDHVDHILYAEVEIN